MSANYLDADTLALLRDSLDRYARERYTLEYRREHLARGDGFSREAWRDYAGLGWLFLPLTTEAGGLNSAPEAIGALMHYAGEALALEPLFGSVVLCGRLFGLAGDDTSRAALEKLASGETIPAFAHAEDDSDGFAGRPATRVRDGKAFGTKRIVLHGDVADSFVITALDDQGRLSFHLVAGDDAALHRQAFRLVDGRGAAHLTLNGAQARPLTSPEDPDTLLTQVLDGARLALCAEALGVVKALNTMTLAYLKERKQFGRAIGTNQVLQHRMVDLYLLQEEGRAAISAAYRAAAADRSVRERRAAIFAASAHMAHAARAAAHDAVQMHGGIGITDELAVSHYFRRAMVLNRLLGDRDGHLRAFGELAGD